MWLKKKKNTNKCWHYYAWFHQMLQNLYLANFWKMNLMEFAVIWVKKGQKAGFCCAREAWKSH